MKDTILNIIFILLCVLILYFVVSSTTFLWRNPKANSIQVIKEFPSVVTWEKINEFQKDNR